MRSTFFGIALSAALIGACASHQDTQEGDINHCKGGDCGSGIGGSGSSSASCPLGAANFTDALGAIDVGFSAAAMDLAVDAQGDVFVGTSGITEISAAGRIAGVSLPEGSLVAVDAEGNLFVAGSFTAAFDLGSFHLAPTGNINVFIAKLDAKGKVLFAKALDECGSGISAMVVSKDGRIAISGEAMGTIVLSARGDVIFADASIFGHLAFDAKGDLVIVGNSARNVAFVAMFDLTGKQILNQTVEASAVADFSFNAVAIDANGNIAIVGDTNVDVTLFGTQIKVHFENEVGRATGAFLVVLDVANGQCVAQRVIDLGLVEANAVAIDAKREIFVGGGFVSAQDFDRLAAVLRVDVSGKIINVFEGQFSGRVLALSIDSCGSLLIGAIQSTLGGVSEIDNMVLKLTL